MNEVARLRREPPPFRRAVLSGREQRGPTMVRLTLEGPELEGLHSGEAASSARLLVPPRDAVAGDRLDLPTWTGNEYRDQRGERPPIRTITPLMTPCAALGPGDPLAIDVVLHGGDGPLAWWAEHAPIGTSAAVSGTARGYDLPEGVARLTVLGDESAVGAIVTVLAALPATVRARVVIELGPGAAPTSLDVERIRVLDGVPDAEIDWVPAREGEPRGSVLVDAARRDVERLRTDEGAALWASGNAPAMQRIRRLLAEAEVPRGRQQVRGYWK